MTRTRARRCEANRANSVQCARSALDGRTLCAQHYGASVVGYVAKPRKHSPPLTAPVYVEPPPATDTACLHCAGHCICCVEGDCGRCPACRAQRPASAYDGLDAAGRVAHHAGCVRDIEAKADEYLADSNAMWLADRIAGHGVRAAVAFLEWCAERTEEHAAPAASVNTEEATGGAACHDAGREREIAYRESLSPSSCDRCGASTSDGCGLGWPDDCERLYEGPRRKRRKRARRVEAASLRAPLADDDLPGVLGGVVAAQDAHDRDGSAASDCAVQGAIAGLRAALTPAAPHATGLDVSAWSNPEPVLVERGVILHHCRADELAIVARYLGGVDALIVDAPYSSVTHAGHDDGAVDANRGADMRARLAVPGRLIKHNGGFRKSAPSDTAPRRTIDYPAWTPSDVTAFVDVWHPLTRGWFVTITDHVLARAWEDALTSVGRYVFAPLPLYSPGSRVRLSGDGPSSWTCWIVVARPATKEYFQWGTLPGGYAVPPERMPIVGGKPLSAMRKIVADYSRVGDLVCDPCAGGGTLGVAAIAEGRRALLGDVDASHVAIAAKRLRSAPPYQPPLRLDIAPTSLTATSLDFAGAT